MLIKKKLPVTIILMVSIPILIVSFFIYHYTSIIFVNNSKNNVIQLTTAENDALTSRLNSEKLKIEVYSQKSDMVDFSEKTQEDLKKSDADKMQDQIKKIINDNSEIYSCDITDKNGKVLFSSNSKLGNIKDEKSIAEALKGKVNIQQSVFSSENNKVLFSIASPIRNDNGIIIGIFIGNIYSDYLKNIFSNVKMGQTGYAYLVDDSGTIIYHPDSNKIGSKVENSEVKNIVKNIKYNNSTIVRTGNYRYQNQNKFMAAIVIQDTKWIFVMSEDMNEINKISSIELYIIMGITLLVLIISTIVSIIFSRSITKPITKLISSMKVAQPGELIKIPDYNVKDEMGELTDKYNDMIEKLNNNYAELSSVYEELYVTEEELRNQYQQLYKSKNALEISENKYRETVEGINDVIWEVNLETNDFYASDNFSKMTGYKNNYDDIKKLIEIAIIPDNNKKFYTDIREHINKKNQVFRNEVEIITSFGKKIWVLNRGKVIYNTDGKAIKILGTFSDISAAKDAQKRVNELAYYDVLTGIPNRTKFIEKLNEQIINSVTKGVNGAVLFVDLDDFKKINDSFGHDVGDKLLKVISEKVSTVIGENDMICRFGGDEFLIMMTDVKSDEEIVALSSKILNVFHKKFNIDKIKLFTAASIGITVFPKDGNDTNIILKNADTAMYKAKDEGKNRYKFYDETMSEKIINDMKIERVLRTAISKNEIYLCYQPQIDLKTGKIIGNEALVRINSKELGHLSPIQFIPIAEKTGLIIPIGEWVMRTALKQNMKWINKNYSEIRISINVSSVQLQQVDFVKNVKNSIDKAGIKPELVEIEITESVLMESMDKNVKILKQLKQYGIRIALDDFGTGYSSLTYLRTIPINILKIDKSFVDDICTNSKQKSIVNGIINIAHDLDIEVVVEGIETIDQLQIINDKKCDIVQGYIFSKPVKSEEIEEMLKNQ
ncbi:EAL domain-containing protein [Clostridium akagii]|uniref:EAL domain-containing protein n=1 Tax=Clostridium akagii TaxID=91623 RepID=UPI00047E9149|nr:EAL domain-containing protein [Clostridium akagii]